MSQSRHNHSTSASIDRTYLFASGTFKNVYEGQYIEGRRAGERCVAKEFKESSPYEEKYFEEEMKIIRTSQKIIDDWHDAGIVRNHILLNIPEIWVYRGRRRDAFSLVEPMINNYEKFNSNSGWVNRSTGDWGELMQALSHFSFHNSDGKLLLCDLQGGVYQDGYILSDPVIMSKDNGKYGPTDLGIDGIRLFFEKHRCTRFCRAEWRTPRHTSQGTIRVRQGTSMVRPRELPARGSRRVIRGIRIR
ncbi:kinase-like domain-containing protein [Xylaria arbuscula]|nr:kinase-like domain-containing protein [Xylaria arbuscula]